MTNKEKIKADREKLNKHMEEIKLMLDEPMELNKKLALLKVWIEYEKLDTLRKINSNMPDSAVSVGSEIIND